MVRKRASAVTVPGSFCRTGTFHIEECTFWNISVRCLGFPKLPDAITAELDFDGTDDEKYSHQASTRG
jgi:hypothetical protein